MKLIAGLGNPGPRYAKTRHNIGFLVADKLASMEGLMGHIHKRIEPDCEVAHGTEKEILLVKPMTMMNLSGRAIGRLARFYKLSPEDVWVIYDDIDLNFGQLRIRRGGSSSHNGVRSVIEALGPDFGRIRVGVANETLKNPIPADQFVLAKFTAEEDRRVDEVISETARIVSELINSGDLTDTTYKIIE
jgi:peptidyl-tRNA hydrolase, PTH1 family